MYTMVLFLTMLVSPVTQTPMTVQFKFDTMGECLMFGRAMLGGEVSTSTDAAQVATVTGFVCLDEGPYY